jgi:hypothetical protein
VVPGDQGFGANGTCGTGLWLVAKNELAGFDCFAKVLFHGGMGVDGNLECRREGANGIAA